ncbi:MAG: hypothetical protein AAGI91_11925 [Bacteroidota bacterium]
MEGLVPIAIWLSLALVALGFLVIAVFGIKSLIDGKHRVWSIGAMVLPLAIFGVCYALSLGTAEPATTAMILTALVLLAGGIVAIVLTGIKGVFN